MTMEGPDIGFTTIIGSTMIWRMSVMNPAAAPKIRNRMLSHVVPKRSSSQYPMPYPTNVHTGSTSASDEYSAAFAAAVFFWPAMISVYASGSDSIPLDDIQPGLIAALLLGSLTHQEPHLGMRRFQAGGQAKLFERLGRGGPDRSNHGLAKSRQRGSTDSQLLCNSEKVTHLHGCGEEGDVELPRSQPPRSFAERLGILRQAVLVDANRGHL